MLVTTAQSRVRSFESLIISPGMLIPISITAISSSLAIFRRVSGTPIWLLLFPEVLKTFIPAESAQAIISLVVVLPTLPVIPILGMCIFSPYTLPRFWSAIVVLSTLIYGISESISSCSLVSTATAPLSMAPSIN